MTDSEDEHEVDEQCSVACAAESAAIVVLGCVAGLKGMSKARKGVSFVESINVVTVIVVLSIYAETTSII